jgi:peptidoglycan/LPS O-acetylase OafA/YrhL
MLHCATMAGLPSACGMVAAHYILAACRRLPRATAATDPAMPHPASSLLTRIVALGRRVTSSGSFVPEIDGLRFIAIAWVLAYHINGEYIKVEGARYAGQIEGTLLISWLHTLNFGVQLFFVISGFILGMPFVRHFYEGEKKPSLRNYYIRRLTRIEPPLIINLTLFLGLLALVKHQPLGELVPHYLASLGYLHNLSFQQLSTINFVTWSLEIEAQFYVLAPFLVAVLALPARVREPALAALIAVWSLLAWYLTQAWPLVGLTLVGQVQYFFAGFLLAAWHCRRSREIPRPGSWAGDGIAVAAWVAMAAMLANRAAWNAPLLPFLVVIAYAGMFRGRLTHRAITIPLLTMIGGMCYTIYLYHPFLKSALKHLTFRLHLGDAFWVNTLAQIVILGGIIVAISGLLFLAFEKPFMHRYWPATAWAWAKRLVGAGGMAPAVAVEPPVAETTAAKGETDTR